MMKVISKLFMLTLILSVFVGCKKEDKDLPLDGRYKGTLTVSIEAEPLPNVLIDITSIPGVDSASIVIPANSIPVVPVPLTAKCGVKSDKDKYSLSGSVSITIPNMGEISVTVNNGSNITKSGKANIDMSATVPQIGSIDIKFDGQKQ